MNRILVPPRPGAFSALGLLCTDIVHDYIRSELMPMADLTSEHAEAIFAELEARALQDLLAEGMKPVMNRYTGKTDTNGNGE